jgi:hypothetical protein
MDPFDTPDLQRVKSRLSARSWQRRVTKAKKEEKVLQQILVLVDEGVALNTAISQVVPPSRRSWAIRHLPKYREHGVSALIDRRTPREPQVTLGCRQALQAARAANPKLSVEEALRILREQKITPLPSNTTVKREFSRVDARRSYAARKARATREVVDLPFAGGELLLAAEIETGGIAALTQTVTQLAESAREEAQDQVPDKDVAYRDRRGRFTVTYNRRRKRRRGEAIASYLRPAAEKALDRVPTWPRFVRERPATIEAKLRMISFGWLVASSKGWDTLRAPDVAGLDGLTGFAYMPSTLAKLVSALAISGAGRPLLATVGQHWHSMAQTHFKEPGAMAALYVDNHAKEVWSSLFTMSGKVSHRNRVMPCITTTYIHTGAGTPVVASVQSGSAPLAPRLVELVAQTEDLLGGAIERAVVIDAEGSTFDLLESFQQRDRVLVTPLRPERTPELELHYSRGSYYRPYREHDELRVVSCTLTQKSTGRSLELGALLVRRDHRESDTVLLTTGLDQGLSGRDLANLYFRRWPVQENAFKEGAAALQLDKHRGNCGRMVANVAVVTKLEQLAARIERARTSLTQLRAEMAALSATVKETARADRKAQSMLATRRQRLDARIERGQTNGAGFAKVALEHQQALVRAESTAHAAQKTSAAYARAEVRAGKLTKQIDELIAQQKHLEPQHTIRQLDVAQDEVLTATKLTSSQLITFTLRQYLKGYPMTPETFVTRVFTVHGRKEIEPKRERERIIFYENPRDPEVTEALRDACRRLNRRRLQREGRRLCYVVEPVPEIGAGRFD